MCSETNINPAMTRIDVLDKVTGRAKYTEDLKLPGMLYGVAGYSKISCGQINRIDLTAVAELPGVRKIVLASDVPGRNALGPSDLDHPIICDKIINYSGDVVALIAADTEENARKAAKLLTIDCKEEKGIYTIDEAMQVPERILNRMHNENGDINDGFAQADVIVEGTYTTPFVDHAYLERECALAVPGVNGIITIYGGSQEPYHVPTVVSEVLGCQREQVRFLGMNIGGAFGGKSETSFMVACRAALLAWHCDLPVLFTVSRQESMLSSTKRHAAKLYYRMGADKEGKLTALEAQVYLDKGAYLMTGGIKPPALNRVFWHYTGPYNVPNSVLDALLVRTNNPCSAQMRSPGVPQVAFAVESQMDRLAEALHMDPLEIRLKNALEAGMTTANGILLKDSVGIKETILRGAELFKWHDYQQDSSRDGRYIRGIGIASFWHGISFGSENDNSEAHILLKHNGSFIVRTGLVEMGQGLQTVLTQTAAVELGVPPELIDLTYPNTEVDPDSKNTTSSRATVVGSLAIKLAVQDAVRFLISQAARYSGLETTELYWDKGSVFSKGYDWKISSEELAAKIGSERPLIIGRGKWQRKLGEKGYTAYGYASHFVEVEVDTETGFIKPLRLTVVQDVGKIMNKKALEGQAIGSASMALGYGLWEHLNFREGRMLNNNLHDYRLPLFIDSPPVECTFVEDPCEEFVYGAKGAGEPSTTPTAAAIANAVNNAIGKRIYELPITQESVTS